MNKKGFTLVELLAIIAILAIIALIATPITINVVETFRKNSFKESTNGLIRAAQLYYSEQVEEANFYGKTFDFSKNTSELSFKGKKPTSGTLVMDSDGLIKINISNGTYCASKDFESNEVVITKSADCTNTSLEPEITMSALSEGTKRIIVKAQCTEVGNTTIKKYEFKIGDKWLSNGKDYYIFDNLEANKEYIVSARCINSVGIVAEKSLSVKTSLILAPTISITPETEYAPKRTVTLNSPVDENGNKITGRFKYEYSVDEGETWEEFEDGFKLEYNKEEDNGKLIIARVVDSKNEYSSNAIISGIDTTKPSASVSVGTIKTDRVTLTATCSDAESGITKYEFSKDGGSTWNDNGTTRTKTYTGLDSEKEYTFKVRCTNGSGLTNVGEKLGTTSGITAPTISYNNSSWSTSKKLTITYSGTNINSPVYFVKSTVSGTTNVALTTCGSTNPKATSDCTGTAVDAGGTITAGTWYKVNSGTSAVIKITSNGSVYAQTGDGTNVKASTTAAITTIDTTAPTKPSVQPNVNWKGNYTPNTWANESIIMIVDSTDAGSGIAYYQFSYDNVNWYSDFSSLGASAYYNNNTQFHFWVTRQGQTNIYVRAVDNLGNISASSDLDTLYIDTVAPSITIGGTYYSHDTSTFYTVGYGVSGGSISCVNQSNGNAAVSTNNTIGILGPNVITCTATGNNGLKTTVTGTVTINYYALGRQLPYVGYTAIRNGLNGNSEPYANLNGSLYLPATAVQYGPYATVLPGCYLVRYNGENLNSLMPGELGTSTSFYKAQSASGGHTMINLNYVSNTSFYYLNLPYGATSLETSIWFYRTHKNIAEDNKIVRIDNLYIAYAGASC